MRESLTVAAESGLIVFRDGSIDRPFDSDREDEQRKALRLGEAKGNWWVIDADDPIAYRFDVCIGQEPDGLPEHRFQRLGGSFLLKLDTGRLVASSAEQWMNPPQAEIEIPPGSYSLTVLGPGDFDAEAYDDEYRSVLGAEDMRFRTVVDRLGLAGCLATLVAALTLVIPATRQFWVAAFVILAVGWLPFFVLRQLPRYQKTERLISEHEAALPHYVLQLQAIDNHQGLSGGHLTTG